MPALAGAQTCSPQWSGAFPGGDFDGPVRAYAMFDDGTGPAMYAGGTFTRAGGMRVVGVAKWTGTGWVQVGGDFDGDVNALCVFDDGLGGGPRLWAGGRFQNVGAVSTGSVARLSGSAWTGIQVSGQVRCLTGITFANGSRGLFAGGDFLRYQSGINLGVVQVGGNSGSPPLPTSSDLDMRVYAMAAYNDPSGPALYAVGAARLFGGGNIARLQTGWSLPGNSQANALDGPGFAAATLTSGPTSTLFVGGDFQHAGSAAASRVARWDGSAWSSVGAGANAPVRTMIAADADGPFGPLPMSLYCGGEFSTAGGINAANIAAWNGGSWASLGSGADGPVLALGAMTGSQNPAVFVGGNFATAGGAAAGHAAAYNGYGWISLANAALGNSPVDEVSAVAWFDDDGPGPDPAKLYVGGSFRSVGAQPIAYIASWDGAAWAPVGGGLNGAVAALRVHDDATGPALYAVGAFTTADGQPASHVARFAAGQWSAVGAGISGVPLAMEWYTPPAGTVRLVVLGSVAPAGSTPNAAVQWTGSAWVGVSTPSQVGGSALAVFDDGTGPRLYASFQGTSAPVSRWDGFNWSPASAGMSVGYVEAMTVFDDGTGPALYAGGQGLFFPGGIVVDVGRFRHDAWTPLAGGPSGEVASLAVFDDGTGPGLYAGGGMSGLGGGTQGFHLSRWRGSWTGIAAAQLTRSAEVLSMAATPPDVGGHGGVLALGGTFLTLNGTSSPNIAELVGCPACYANCDRSTAAPVLNVNDFLCFQLRFAAGDSYANCDGSTTPPVLNVGDFVCFMNSFAGGCP